MGQLRPLIRRVPFRLEYRGLLHTMLIGAALVKVDDKHSTAVQFHQKFMLGRIWLGARALY